MKALGIIPARGGSDGVPSKNLRKVAGEPLITYAIRAGQCSSLMSLTVISDDDNTLGYARALGCDAMTMLRDLANGPVAAAAKWALLQYHDIQFDAVVLLQPDSPIRLPTDIDNCLKMLSDNPDADGVISVYKVEDAHPAHMYAFVYPGPERLLPVWGGGDYEIGPRQNLPSMYLRNGAIYAVRRETLMTEGWIPKSKLGYVMPRELSLTIDTEFDLLMAERQVQLWKEGKLTKPVSSGLTLSPSTREPSPTWMG